MIIILDYLERQTKWDWASTIYITVENTKLDMPAFIW